MKTIYLSIAALLLAAVVSCKSEPAPVILGSERTDVYVPELQGKKIGLLSNHSGITPGGKHSLEIMLENGLDVKCIFSPEHGFRGNVTGGEHIGDSVDEATGVPIVSMYGNTEPVDLSDIDVVVVDIQDVGLRYYTYYVTMVKLMNKAIEYDKEFMVFDRPNPNGMYVDGPILDMNFKSGIGVLPIPIVHGLTLGEMAKMADGEGWLENGAHLKKLTVIPCENYTHQTRYSLLIKPSPNLTTMQSVYLYSSLCFFEGTPISMGHGTDKPFQVYGHPDMTGPYEFTPTSNGTSREPRFMDTVCHGRDLSIIDSEEVIAKGIDLTYLLDAYNQIGKDNPNFFTRYFELLFGTDRIRPMIEQGMSAEEIKATWADDVASFKEQRKPYLLYEE